jgi:hypothetical protein
MVGLFCRRSLVQQVRAPFNIALYNGLTIIAAGIFAWLYYGKDPYVPPFPVRAFAGCAPVVASACQLSQSYNGDGLLVRSFLATIAISLVGMATFLQVFSQERVVYWREASTLQQPWHTIAYFIGKDAAMLPQMLLGPFVFGLSFFALAAPRADFGLYYIIFLGLYFASSAYGYVISAVVPPSLAFLAGVVAIFTTAMVSGAVPSLKDMRTKMFPLYWLPDVAFERYGVEALYLYEVDTYKDIINLQGLKLEKLISSNYDYDQPEAVPRKIAIIFLFGFVLRLVALALLLVVNADKKK